MKCERRWEGQLRSCPLSSLNQLESSLLALFLFPLLILPETWLSRAGPPSGHLATTKQASGRSYVSPWMAKKGRTWAWVGHLAETNERWFTVSESQVIIEGEGVAEEPGITEPRKQRDQTAVKTMEDKGSVLVTQLCWPNSGP